MMENNIPKDAMYFIIKNDETDWSKWQVEPGDIVFFKSTPGDLAVEIESYSSPQEAISASIDSNLRQALGCLYRWDGFAQEWVECEEPFIECMWWHAEAYQGSKIFRV